MEAPKGSEGTRSRGRLLGAAAQGEAWLQSMIDSLPYQVYLKDAQGRFLMVNRAMVEAIGKPPGDIIGRNLSDLLPDRDAASRCQQEARILETGVPLEDCVYSHTDAQGQQHWYSETEARVPLPHGGFGLVGVTRELNPQQQAAERLRIQKELAVRLLSAETIEAALSDALRAAIEGTGADGGAAYLADPASESLSLYEAVSLSPPPRLPLAGFSTLGEGQLRTIHMATSQLDAYPEVRDALAAQGVRCFAAAPLGQPDHLLASLHVASRAFDRFPPEAREHLEAVVALAGQALARVAAQCSLRESESRYRTMLQEASDALFVLALTDAGPGQFIDANDQAVRLLGYSRAELLSMSITDVDVPEQLAHVPGIIARLRDTGSAVFETEHLTKDGRRVPVEVSARLIDLQGQTVVLAAVRDVTDRHRAEAALRESQRRLMDIIDSLPDATFVLDASGRVTAWNRAIQDMTGVPAEAVVGQGGYQHAIPFYGEPRPSLADLLLQGLEPAPDRYRMISREGGVVVAEATVPMTGRGMRDLWARAVLLHDDRGAVVGAIETIRDVTERRRAEEALRDSERQLADIIDFLPDATFVIDTHGRVVAWNRAIEEMTGIPAHEILGKGDHEYTVPFYGYRRKCLADLVLRYDDVAEEYYPGIRREGGALVAEIPSVCPRGRDMAVWAKATPLRDRDGRITGAIEAIRDITERRRAEEALRAREEQYRLIVETSNEGILATDPRGVIRFANPRMAEIVGHQLAQLIGRNAAEFMDPEEAADHARRMAERATGVSAQYERRLRHSDGHEVWVAISSTPIIDDDGRLTGSFAMVTDITERKRAERERELLETQLADARKLESIGQLAGGVAHDLNNMLAPILGYAELLAGDPAADPRQQSALQEIIKAAQRARDLVRQLLAFARRQTLNVRPIDLNKVVVDLEPMLRRTIRENVDIALDLDPALPSVQGDAGQIEQIILNLAVNAQDAMPDGGVLAIGTSAAVVEGAGPDCPAGIAPGRYALLTVRDNGVGMDEATLSRAFEPFFTTKATGRGTGLGLSTVYGIATQHGGHVAAQSEVGKGTVIRVYLPQAAEAPESNVSGTPEGPAAGNETVMVVEDQAQVRDLVGAMLEQSGYTVLSAADGAEAVELSEGWKGPIHLLVTDVIMRGMNGRQVYQSLLSKRPELKVLYMSGYPSNVITHHGVIDPGVQFIPKPFALRDFTAKVRQVLDTKPTGPIA